MEKLNWLIIASDKSKDSDHLVDEVGVQTDWVPIDNWQIFHVDRGYENKRIKEVLSSRQAEIEQWKSIDKATLLSKNKSFRNIST